ncbi:hypothetical protein [Aliikangiella maris]|uniref:Uncharacterized protein n=2 Tax=Aliikangiella maris TaxID=3162458 RepID=A0ABV3MU16_9GAMM
MRSILISTALALSFLSSVDASDMHNAVIEKMMVDTANGEVLFIKAAGDVNAAPSCSTNQGWQYVLPLTSDLTKNNMMSLLLSARMAGTKVRLLGKGVCDAYSSIETLQRIEV